MYMYLIFKNSMVGHSTPLPHIETSTVNLNDVFGTISTPPPHL